MPIVTVQLGRGRDASVKSRLAGEIAKLLADTLDVDPEWVATVLFQELDRENWSTGGRFTATGLGLGYGRQGVE